MIKVLGIRANEEAVLGWKLRVEVDVTHEMLQDLAAQTGLNIRDEMAFIFGNNLVSVIDNCRGEFYATK